MTTNHRTTAQEIFRSAILEAMDEAAREIMGGRIKTNCAGADDEDLPRLFKCFDEQLEILAIRFNHPLHEDIDPANLPTAWSN